MTTSKATVVSASASFEVEFSPFSNLLNVPSGSKLISDTISLLGQKWSILLFPNGDVADSAGYCSVYLCRSSTTIDCGDFLFDMKCIGGTLVGTPENYVESCGFALFKAEVNEWGYNKLFKHDTRDFTKGNDFLKIVINLQLANGYGGNSCIAGTLPSTMTNYVKRNVLTNLKTNDLYIQDFVIECNGQQFHVNSELLKKYSKVFAAMFNTQCKEVEDKKIVMNDTTLEAVSLLILWLRIGAVDDANLHKHGEALLKLALKYDFQELAKLTLLDIIHHISIDNFFDYVELAMEYDDVDNCLKYTLVNFAVVNLKTITSKKEIDKMPLEFHKAILLSIGGNDFMESFQKL